MTKRPSKADGTARRARAGAARGRPATRCILGGQALRAERERSLLRALQAFRRLSGTVT